MVQSWPLLFGPVPTDVEDEFANQMLDFYISFIWDLNPGSECVHVVNGLSLLPLGRRLGTVYTDVKTCLAAPARQHHYDS